MPGIGMVDNFIRLVFSYVENAYYSITYMHI